MTFEYEKLHFGKFLPARILYANSAEFSPRPMHWHRSIELTYLYKGECEVWIDGEEIIVNDDDLFFINSGSIHCTKLIQGCVPTILIIQFSYEFLKERYPYFDDIRFEIDKTLPAYSEMKELFKKILTIYQQELKSEYLALELNSHIYKILYILFQYFKLERSISTTVFSEKYFQRFQKIMDYMNNNFIMPMTLESVASLHGISREHLSRSFKKYIGSTFKEYLGSIRIYHAFNKLVHTDLPVVQVALDNGYSDARAFIQHFKQKFNKTPSQYRKEMRKSHF